MPLLLATAGCQAIVGSYGVVDGGATTADAADSNVAQTDGASDGTVDTDDGRSDGPGSCATTSGPTLTGAGDAHTGMQFHATSDVTLKHFTFYNNGLADTVQLLDSSCANVLHTVSIPAANPTYVANVSWPLTSGTSYQIISLAQNNTLDQPTTAFPWKSGNLVVEDSICCDMDCTLNGYWIGFGELVTCE